MRRLVDEFGALGIWAAVGRRKKRAFVPSGAERPLEGRRLPSIAPYVIPLQLVDINTRPADPTVPGTASVPIASKKNASPAYKLGVYVGLGGDSNPRLYEFDTGGEGFWAASDKRSPKDLRWWGAHKLVGRKTLNITYSSGNQYVANKVKTSVELYQLDADGGFTKVVGTGQDVDMGKIVRYSNVKAKGKAAVKAWKAALTVGAPPLQNWFYGDFGASLAPNGKSDKDSLLSIVPQIPIPAGLTIGFIVHVGDPTQVGNQPQLQIGLAPEDLKSFDVTLPMNSYTGKAQRFFPITGVDTYSQRIAKADFTWTAPTTKKSQTYKGLNWTIDTGASSVTVWQGDKVAVQRSFLASARKSGGWYGGGFKPGVALDVQATASGAIGKGVDMTIVDGSTSSFDDGLAANYHAKGSMGRNYVNTGFYTFTQYDVMYNLQEGTISFRTPRLLTQAQTQAEAQG